MKKIYTQPIAEVMELSLGTTFICALSGEGTQDFGTKDSSPENKSFNDTNLSDPDEAPLVI